MSARPVTPPPRQDNDILQSIQLTPEQVKRLTRTTAKARQREREQAATASSSSSSTTNANNKRPLGVIPASSTSPTGAPKPKPKDRPLQRDARLGKYFDYDLSKMVNSKGGFLVDDEKEVTEDARIKERERERERAMQNLEPAMSLDPTKNPKCEECGSIYIDQTFRKVLRCLVCNKCKEEKPEKYSLLTKTECKEDYLLTDAELRDEELMPHLLKANPHKATYHNMMLFLRCQVEDFAWKKWGSPEALDAEFERRQEEKKKKKAKKFEEGLRELRRRTRESVWQRRKDEEHKHVFGAVERGNNGEGRQSISLLDGLILGCILMKHAVLTPEYTFNPDSDIRQTMSAHGELAHLELTSSLMPSPLESVEREVVTDAIGIERSSKNTFYSKSLWTPHGHPSVYGGQMMGQAVHAASLYDDQSFQLHCYFLHGTTDTVPITYQVSRLKQGRSFTSYLVKATQDVKPCMLLMCSFQKPVPHSSLPLTQWPVPEDVPPPETLELDGEYYLRLSKDANPEMKPILLGIALDRARISIILTVAVDRVGTDGCFTTLRWMKAVGAAGCDLATQKCILAYMSDFDFIGVAPKALRLKRLGRGPGNVKTIVCHFNIKIHPNGTDLVLPGMDPYSQFPFDFLKYPLPSLRSDDLARIGSYLSCETSHQHYLGPVELTQDYRLRLRVLAPREAWCLERQAKSVFFRIHKFYTRDGKMLAVAMQEGVIQAYGNVDTGDIVRSKL
ncbi:uncharacterized protein FOMMEDRAFT_28037 [Fomitiporia mediterranea MF3/22]|uniref:uncharacterized protein n=1 Tax=Fomitiporia mediterranea (strain MF3/22) TaxID=694068 RepID=UPI0004409A45|nr:uncharacterized protein FOMMEDRAFT_28037 [Fomitiporia mediterranea MF3/22]EJD04305.1 hypothetical protein FOMMEDRAFT_28037 [Fomitiporia mediterranea MF3/22]